jgi:hypothetical protein
MHPYSRVERALELGAAGWSAKAVGGQLGIPRRTVAGWLAGERSARKRRADPELDRSSLPTAQRAYLLGLYLGDGHLVHERRGVYRLAIACDAAYPGIVASAATAIQAVLPHNKVRTVRHPVDQCIRVYCSSKLFPALFPQHGPGRKHARRIELTDWQAEITAAHPRELLRGLLHSDGCRYVARQRVGPKTYRYVRYSFSNRSADIKRIFCAHLDLLGIGWTVPNASQIAIARRADVAKLDVFVGPKR